MLPNKPPFYVSPISMIPFSLLTLNYMLESIFGRRNKLLLVYL